MTQLPVPQKFLTCVEEVTLSGTSIKCHGAVVGSTLRSSSAQVDASTKGSRPVLPQKRLSCGSIGFALNKLRSACFASCVRCFSARAATVSCPRQPQARTPGANAKHATTSAADNFSASFMAPLVSDVLRVFRVLGVLSRTQATGRRVSPVTSHFITRSASAQSDARNRCDRK
jgi:hypothetical protein